MRLIGLTESSDVRAADGEPVTVLWLPGGVRLRHSDMQARPWPACTAAYSFASWRVTIGT